mgnify:CR=1 FL=1
MNVIRHSLAALALALALALPGVTGAVDINSADAQTLAEELHGIGLAKAEAIVAYREANGPFTSTEDLTKVKGVGAATVEKNRDAIQVGGGKPKAGRTVARND